MEQKEFLKQLEQESPFSIRRAVERLREGLFDPVAVRLLTAHENQLNRVIDKEVKTLQKKNSAHLCICGSYGQGKSHSLTYIQDRALKENYVTSMINLDLRELPLHNFRQIYRALLNNLRFPNSEEPLGIHWRKWAQAQLQEQQASPLGPESLLPEGMPHLFKCILTGMAQRSMALTASQKQLKKHALYRPKDYTYLLEKALLGETIPVNRLSNALKYRQVAFYRKGSLSSKGNDLYLTMLESLGLLFQKMGYEGWVLLFDEGESIAQVSVYLRRKSYAILQQLLLPQSAQGKLFPVFAFTEDFFQRVESEDYEKTYIRFEQEIPYFSKNYSDTWQGLSRYDLQDLTQQEWDSLAQKLIPLYGHAYRWQPEEASIHGTLMARLKKLAGEETRYKLKALIEQLDLFHQEALI